MITSRQNQRLKDIRRLRRSKGERALLEGPHLVGEAVDLGLAIEAVFASDPFAATAPGRRLLERLPHPPEMISAELLDGLTDSDSPRGVLAVVALPRPGCARLPLRARGVYLYVSGIQDPGNLGALARVAEAAGAAAMALAPGCAHPNHPRALRASAGSLLRLPVVLASAPEDLAAPLAALDNPPWVALVPSGGDELYSAPLAAPLVLALGAERGLPPEVAARAHRLLTVPMAPPVESLNVTVAAALVLFELRRRGALQPPG